MKVIIFTSEADLEDQALANLCTELANRYMSYQIVQSDSSPQPVEVVTYDIVTTPAVVVAQDDGAPQQIWQHHMPSIDQVSNAFGYV